MKIIFLLTNILGLMIAIKHMFLTNASAKKRIVNLVIIFMVMCIFNLICYNFPIKLNRLIDISEDELIMKIVVSDYPNESIVIYDEDFLLNQLPDLLEETTLKFRFAFSDRKYENGNASNIALSTMDRVIILGVWDDILLFDNNYYKIESDKLLLKLMEYKEVN
jgi:hypothetical protein